MLAFYGKTFDSFKGNRPRLKGRSQSGFQVADFSTLVETLNFPFFAFVIQH